MIQLTNGVLESRKVIIVGKHPLVFPSHQLRDNRSHNPKNRTYTEKRYAPGMEAI
jgi:hypothetical protein